MQVWPTTIPGELVILGSLSPKERSVGREVSESWGEMTRRGLNGLLPIVRVFVKLSESICSSRRFFGRTFLYSWRLSDGRLTQANTPPSIGEEFITQPGHPYYWARWRRLGVGAPWSRPVPQSENPSGGSRGTTVPAGGTESQPRRLPRLMVNSTRTRPVQGMPKKLARTRQYLHLKTMRYPISV